MKAAAEDYQSVAICLSLISETRLTSPLHYDATLDNLDGRVKKLNQIRGDGS